MLNNPSILISVEKNKNSCKDIIAQRRCEGKAVSHVELGQFLPLKTEAIGKLSSTPTVLLVEDNDIIRQGYSHILQ